MALYGDEDRDAEAAEHGYAERRRAIARNASDGERQERAIVGSLYRAIERAVFDFEIGLEIDVQDLELKAAQLASTIGAVQSRVAVDLNAVAA